MKIKMAREVREMIQKMSLNEYLSQSNEGLVQKKRDMIDLDTHDALLARNKHISKEVRTGPDRSVQLVEPGTESVSSSTDCKNRY